MTERPPTIGDILWTIARPADDYIDDQPGRPMAVEIIEKFEIGAETWHVGSPYSWVTGKANREKDRECEAAPGRLFDTEVDAWEAYAAEMRELANRLGSRAEGVLREAWKAEMAVDRLMGGN